MKDIQRTVEDLKSKQVKFSLEPRKQEYGTEAMCLDPDGYTIHLLQPAY